MDRLSPLFLLLVFDLDFDSTEGPSQLRDLSFSVGGWFVDSPLTTQLGVCVLFFFIFSLDQG